MIRVLVIDDSAFARKVIREVLSRDPEIEVVGTARDGLEGLEKIVSLRPDVVTLDLIMPDLDGLGVLRALLGVPAAPKVIIVSVSGADTELAIEALQMGAVDLVAKPTAVASDRLYELSNELVKKVKDVSQARVTVPRARGDAGTVKIPSPGLPSARLVVVGTSTGGPQAISELFKGLPEGLPVAIVIALHIPMGYTASLAARVSQVSAVKLREAEDGMELKLGEAVIAPGGQHLRVRAEDGRLFAVVSRDPIDSPHHPSVDVLFESVAEQVGKFAIGVVMTGMGSDGLVGSRAIRQAGGRVIAESASSCVVYGMPRSVIEAGVSNTEAPLERMAAKIVELIYDCATVS